MNIGQDLVSTFKNKQKRKEINMIIEGVTSPVELALIRKCILQKEQLTIQEKNLIRDNRKFMLSLSYAKKLVSDFMKQFEIDSQALLQEENARKTTINNLSDSVKNGRKLSRIEKFLVQELKPEISIRVQEISHHENNPFKHKITKKNCGKNLIGSI